MVVRRNPTTLTGIKLPPVHKIMSSRPAWTEALMRGFKRMCPRCGKGKMFAGYLTPRESCENCGLAFEPLRADDAPAYFTVFLVGHVVIAGTPPFALFPAMPATLGRYLSERAAVLDEVSRQICASRPCTTWVTMTGVPGPDLFATDRFHLSAVGYREWARVIAGHLPL